MKVEKSLDWLERVRARIGELGMSQAEFAKFAGFSKSQFGNYMQGTRQPGLLEFGRIAAALNVTSDWLLYGGKQVVVSGSPGEVALLLRIRQLPASARRDIEGFIRVHSRVEV